MTPTKTPHRPASRTRAAGTASSRPVLPAGGANARAGEAHPAAKVTAATVRAWRAEAARVARARLRATAGVNARTGEPLSSLFRRTGLFARLAREHAPQVSVAAVCMAVYGDTWADLPGALPKYVPASVPASALGSSAGRTRGRPATGA